MKFVKSSQFAAFFKSDLPFGPVDVIPLENDKMAGSIFSFAQIDTFN